MFGSAIIVFRETLEAALLLGIVAAAARNIPGRDRWLLAGVLAGILGSLVVAGLTGRIAEMADGLGQELFNATILGLAVLMLGWHNIWMARHAQSMVSEARAVIADVADGRRDLSALAIVIALAVLREGSETALFLFGLASGGQAPGQIVGGGALGLAAGAAVGVALYAGLLRIPVRHFFTVTAGLVLFLAAGMAGQMARVLIQGDFLPALANPLWDTSSVLPMDSPAGTLLHVLAGYDARPSGMQILVYGAVLLLILIGMRLVKPLPRRAVAMA
ncbi:MAG: FTR1 family protein [Zoogloeaceae bacterium]|nr:FTR1 family protein [Zoogloeaceae bacterium]